MISVPRIEKEYVIQLNETARLYLLNIKQNFNKTKKKNKPKNIARTFFFFCLFLYTVHLVYCFQSRSLTTKNQNKLKNKLPKEI